MYFTLYNMIMHECISQINYSTLFNVQYSSFRRTVSGRRQLGSSEIEKGKKLKLLAEAEGTPSAPMTRSKTRSTRKRNNKCDISPQMPNQVTGSIHTLYSISYFILSKRKGHLEPPK